MFLCFKPNRRICTTVHKKCFTSCPPLKHLLFCSDFHGLSVTSGGGLLFSISQGCRRKPPKNISCSAINSLNAWGKSLGACLQHTVKYSVEIPSWCIHMALLSNEQRSMRSESSLATFNIAVPELVSSVFHHCGLFVLRLCWNCTASGSEAAMNIAISRRYVSYSIAPCRHASSLPEPWNPTCKTGTIVWPIKYTDRVSNTFWQYCKVSLELSIVMRARWIMQMFEHSCKTAQYFNLFPQGQWTLLKAQLIFPNSKVRQEQHRCEVPEGTHRS